ncbi:MAG: flotillin domain-containing protein [Pseudomonadota bacterium]
MDTISGLIGVAVPVLVGLAFLVFVGFVLARFYQRASREVSLVKTGAGGKVVVMDGGTLVIPLLHEIAEVNMKTLRLEVRREREAALITKDRMRVDVGAEFYVSVGANADSIARAAQTLGDRTFEVAQLREMIEGKLVDALRAVAAQMTMDELHENRSDFVQQVQQTVEADLLKNGLELESVSLTALDQTPFEHLDENNAFNAVGMRALAEVIAESKKRRAEIDAEAEAAVAESAMLAEKRKLEIAREEEAARIAQQQQIETLQAAQEAAIAARQQESQQAADEARITRERATEVAEQERQIVTAQKSEEESRARASADLARAEAIKAQEAVETVKAVAEAERLKAIALIAAAEAAEVSATAIRVEAEAEKQAASDRADAVREAAIAEADAMKLKAQAVEAEMLARARGDEALIAAENALAPQLIALRTRLAEIEAAPRLAAELVKPAERIDGIRINHITGLGGAGTSGSSAPVSTGAMSDVTGAILSTALKLPAMQQLGKELGLTLTGELNSSLSGAESLPAEPAEAEELTGPLEQPEEQKLHS